MVLSTCCAAPKPGSTGQICPNVRLPHGYSGWYLAEEGEKVGQMRLRGKGRHSDWASLQGAPAEQI